MQRDRPYDSDRTAPRPAGHLQEGAASKPRTSGWLPLLLGSMLATLLVPKAGLAQAPGTEPLDFRSVSGQPSVVLPFDNVTQVAPVLAMQPVTPQPSALSLSAVAAPSLVAASLFDQGVLGTVSPRWLSEVLAGPRLLAGPGTDAPTVLNNEQGVRQGAVVPSRTPIVHDAILRGRRLGQVPGRGSYWFPARQDLDTALSKIDSDLVGRITAIKGPYSALYGPGLAFYDVELLGAPRYAHGFESHGSTSLDYQTNGEQWNGRQRLWGGTTDWGYRIGYGHRTGSDYRTGSGERLPTSYNSRNPYVAIGGDLTENSHVQLSYLRLDQTNVEFPGQIFDIRYLGTDAYDLKFGLENQSYFDSLSLEAWYNRTRFDGNNLSPGKRRQIPTLDNFVPSPFSPGRLVGFTNVDAMSTGFRLAFSWGTPECGQLTAGVDLRYLKQQLNEFNQVVDFFPNLPIALFNQFVNSPIPKSHSSNPGLLIESVIPLSDRLSVKTGGRMDWVSTNADQYVPGAVDPILGTPLNLQQFLLGEFDQHFNLWSAFLTAEYEVNDSLTAVIGGGHSMRPPTMTELYAAEPFLAVLPQFAYTNAIGDPNLDPEELWQIDAGLRADAGYVRAGIHGFYSWIEDYITFDLIRGFTYSYLNTDLATLSGGEVYGEVDWNGWITSFAVMSYVEGRDQTRAETVSPRRNALFPGTPRSGVSTTEEPLPVMPPLESRLGIRIHGAQPDPYWMLEFSAQVVDNQDRVATSLREEPTAGYTTYDVRAYWRPYEDLLLTAGVENLSDKFYRTFFDTRVFSQVFQPGVSFYFGSELSY